MPNLTDLTGLAGVASAIAATMLMLPGIAQLPKLRLATLLGAVFVLALIPFGEIPLAAYVRGATGDLSITTLVLLWYSLLRAGCDCVSFDARHRHGLLILIALTAVVLYPLALGINLFDPYRLGYGELLFIAALLLIVLAAGLMKSLLIALCVTLAVFAWSIGWYESDNLWDYLLDPLVSTYALCAITIRTVKQLATRQRNTSIP